MNPSSGKLVFLFYREKVNMCIAKGCKKPAVMHPEWDNEYCSIICCYNHCKLTFQAWLTENKATSVVETNTTLSSTQVADFKDQVSSNPQNG